MRLSMPAWVMASSFFCTTRRKQTQHLLALVGAHVACVVDLFEYRLNQGRVVT